MLSENNQIIFDEYAITDTMIKYFVNITNKLKFKSIQTVKKTLLVSKILERYKYHQSFVKI